jgi:hypothetical protein
MWKLSILLLLLNSVAAISQETVSRQTLTNTEIINNLLDTSTNSIRNRIIILGTEKIYYLNESSGSEESGYFFTRLKQKLQNLRITSELIPGKTDYSIEVNKVNLKTKYKQIYTKNFLGSKRVKRQVEVNYNYSIKDIRSNEEVFRDSISKKYSDSFDMNDLENIENANLRFTRGTLPEENFFSRYLLPGVIIISSAIAVILFFTIRSK